MTKSKVIADMSMSLDGFIADENDGTDQLFGWYGNGDVEVPTADPRWTFRVTEASAGHLRPALSGRVGALLCGRRVFDLTGGWGGRHPLGCPVFVVSHSVPQGWPRPDSPTTFYDDPSAALAAAREAAGERDIAVSTPSLTRQYLAAGELDEIVVSLVPVLLGRGIRYFDEIAGAPVRLSDPTVIEGRAVTHLTYRVLKQPHTVRVAYDETLAQRLHEKLDEPGITAKKMFGGLAFLTHGNMTVGVHGDELIVRLDPEAIPAALERPGVRPFEVGGRSMRGWILVDGERLDDPELDAWIAEARTFVASLPPK